MPDVFLALDAATDACSAAFGSSFSNALVENAVAPRVHSQLLQDQVMALQVRTGNALLQQLSAIIVGKGPGSFAGIRIATALAQGLAFVHQIPLIGVSSLLATAVGYCHNHSCGDTALLVINDAKMGELYVGWFQKNGHHIETLQSERLLTVERWQWSELSEPFSQKNVVVISATPEIFSQLPPSPFLLEALPQYSWAQHLLQAGRDAFLHGNTQTPELFEPCYLRTASAWKTLDS